MKLFFWQALNLGGEYADNYIAVIAADLDQALALIENDAREWVSRCFGECQRHSAEVLKLDPSEPARIWTWG